MDKYIPKPYPKTERRLRDMDNNLSVLIGKRLRKLREERKLTRKALAEKYNATIPDDTISEATIKNYELGSIYKPSVAFLNNFCEVFGCDLDFLVGRIDNTTHYHKFYQERLGLSEQAADYYLQLHNDLPGFDRLFNHLLQDDDFHQLFIDLLEAENWKKGKDKPFLASDEWLPFPDYYPGKGKHDAITFFMQDAQYLIRKAAEHYIEGVNEE